MYFMSFIVALDIRNILFYLVAGPAPERECSSVSAAALQSHVSD